MSTYRCHSLVLEKLTGQKRQCKKSTTNGKFCSIHAKKYRQLRGGGNECIKDQFTYQEFNPMRYGRGFSVLINHLNTTFDTYNKDKSNIDEVCNRLEISNKSLCSLMRSIYKNYSGHTGPYKSPSQICDDDDPNKKDCIIKVVMSNIPNIRPVNDQRRIDLINNEKFIQAFYELCWTILRPYGLHTKGLKSVILFMAQRINEITGQTDYCVIQCKKGSASDPLDNYVCGRAMLPSYHANKPKIIIFDTISEDDDHMDTSSYNRIFS